MEHGGHMSRFKRNAALQVCMHFLKFPFLCSSLFQPSAAPLTVCGPVWH